MKLQLDRASYLGRRMANHVLAYHGGEEDPDPKVTAEEFLKYINEDPNSPLLKLAPGWTYEFELDEYRSDTDGNSYHGFYMYIRNETKGTREFTALLFIDA